MYLARPPQRVLPSTTNPRPSPTLTTALSAATAGRFIDFLNHTHGSLLFMVFARDLFALFLPSLVRDEKEEREGQRQHYNSRALAYAANSMLPIA
jgi:hypothetical protein